MRVMRSSLFRTGVAPRLAAAAVFGVLAFAAVAMVESTDTDRPRTARAETPAAAATTPATICLQSIQPVGAWAVHVDGVRLEARRADATTWLGTVSVASDFSLVVDASPARGGAAPRNALRIRIAGTPVSRDQTIWCEREWSVAARAGQLAAAPAPIDPEALP